MILHHDPLRMPEPPPRMRERRPRERASGHLRVWDAPQATPRADARPARDDALRLAADIARPALRLASLAAGILLVALVSRLGASTDSGSGPLWGTALAGLAVLGLLELPPRRRRIGQRVSPDARRDHALAGDRAVVRSARHWASIVTLLAMTSVALLVAIVAAGPAASAVLCGVAIGGVLLARAILLVPAAA